MSRIFALPWSQILNKPSIGDLSGILPLDKLPAHTHSWADIPGLLPIEKLPLHNHDSSYYTKAQVDAAIGGIDLSSRVPYTGATGAVNLGSNGLTADTITTPGKALNVETARLGGVALVSYSGILYSGAIAGSNGIGHSIGTSSGAALITGGLRLGATATIESNNAYGPGDVSIRRNVTGPSWETRSAGGLLVNNADGSALAALQCGQLTASTRTVTPTAWIGDSVRLYGSATGRMRIFNYAETTGVGLDVATDGTLKVMDKAFAGLSTLQAGTVDVTTITAPSDLTLKAIGSAMFLQVNNGGWTSARLGPGYLNGPSQLGLSSTNNPSVCNAFLNATAAGTVSLTSDIGKTTLGTFNTGVLGNPNGTLVLSPFDGKVIQNNSIVGFGSGLGGFISDALRGFVFSQYTSNITNGFEFGLFRSGTNAAVLATTQAGTTKSALSVGEFTTNRAAFGSYAPYIQCLNESGRSEVELQQGLIAGYGGTLRLRAGDVANTGYMLFAYNFGYPQITASNGITITGGTNRIRMGGVYLDMGGSSDATQWLVLSATENKSRAANGFLSRNLADTAYAPITGGPTIANAIVTADVPLKAVGVASQTGNLFETRNSSNQLLFNVGPTGVVKFTTATGGVYAEFNHGSTHTFYAGGDAFAVLTGDGTTRLYNNGALCWNTGATASSGVIDVRLKRPTAGTLRIEANNGLDVRNLAGTAQSYVVSGPRQSTVAPNTTDIASGACVWWHDSTANARRFAYNDTGSIYQSPLLKSSIPATPSDLAGVIAALQHWGLCA